MRKTVFTLASLVVALVLPPILQAQTTDATLCLGDQIVLTVPGNINEYVGGQWSPAAGLSDTGSLTPTFTPTAPGEYTFTFKAKNIGSGLFPNGDFESGNADFTSGYNFVPPTDDQILWTEGNYTMTDQPSAVHSNSTCTTVSERGQMMAINGGSTASTIVWQPAASVSVTPNTDYAFSAWIMRWTPDDPAQLQFQINGENLGAIQTPPTADCEWGQVYVTWNSGNNTIADITLLNMQTSPSGNDFAIDDVSFALSNDISYTFKITVVDDCNSTENLDICEGEELVLNENDNANYINPQWNPATGLSNPTAVSPVFTPETPGAQTYVFTGMDTRGLTVQRTYNILINTTPVIISAKPEGRDLLVTADTDNGLLQPFIYQIDNNKTYDQPLIEGLNIGMHSVAVVNTAGCRSRELAFRIEAVEILPENYFTPNGDEDNNTWDIAGIDFYDAAIVEIYDRNGKLLQQYQGDFQGWDGTFNGENMPSTDYWYVIQIQEIDMKETGHFSLLR
jgi:gliding motility-associated-like protein